jgi:hypothetical protein
MRRRAKQTIDAEVLASWRGRFALLGERLAQNPTSELAWFWRVQWDILNYLLHRYGGDEKQAGPGSTGQGSFVGLASAENPVLLENRPSGAFAAYTGEGKMPRASGQIRPILEKIVQGNQERHELLRRLREEMAEAKRLQRQQNREWTEWVKEYLREYDLLDAKAQPASEQLSDDEIVDILSKMIAMEEPGDEDGKTDLPPIDNDPNP